MAVEKLAVEKGIERKIAKEAAKKSLERKISKANSHMTREIKARAASPEKRVERKTYNREIKVYLHGKTSPMRIPVSVEANTSLEAERKFRKMCADYQLRYKADKLPV